MKNLLIIVSFVCMIGGAFVSCRGERDAIELKSMRAELIDIEPRTRWEDGQFKNDSVYYYRGQDNVIYYTTVFFGKITTLHVRR